MGEKGRVLQYKILSNGQEQYCFFFGKGGGQIYLWGMPSADYSQATDC